jgi:pimeloyl-ACP methyl ester carboxylesterase
VNGDLWRKVAPVLAGDHRCIVPDLPLGGHSIPLNDEPDLSLFGAADLLASFLDALDLSDVALVANDTGGAISQALVGRRPERIGRLVLTSCDLSSLRTNAGVRRDFAQLLRGARARDCRQAAERLPGFEKPALVAWAADDKFFPRRHGRLLAELLPQGRFELVEDSRTFIPEDNPMRLVELVREFLAEHDRGGGRSNGQASTLAREP